MWRRERKYVVTDVVGGKESLSPFVPFFILPDLIIPSVTSAGSKRANFPPSLLFYRLPRLSLSPLGTLQRQWQKKAPVLCVCEQVSVI